MTRVRARARAFFAHTWARYLFAVAMVALAYGLRVAMAPWTGAGAPFVLFFGAMLVTSIMVGVGPALFALALGLPIAAITFAMPAGALPGQAAFQAALFGLDGLVIVYLAHAMRRDRVRATLSEERTKQIIDLAPDAYFQADLNGRIVEANRAGCELLGYTRDELIGKMILDLVPPEEAPRVAALRAQLLSGRALTAEWTQLRKDGTSLPVEASTTILPGGRWQSFVRDISERRRESERLRQSEEQFRLTFDEAPIGIAIVALDGPFKRVNRAFCEMLGYTAAELEQKTFLDITHPDDLEATLEEQRRALASKTKRYQLEKRYLRKDGTSVTVQISGSIVPGPDGRPLHYLAQFEDITERRQAEEAVRLSEAKFSGIVTISADAIITVDDQRRITIFNKAAENVFGYSAGELLGMPLDALLPDVASHVGERLATLQGLRKSGQPFPVEASMSRLDVAGATLLTVACRDVTERVRHEKEQQLLSDLGVTLAATLDYEKTLAALAQLVVRDFADWCLVDIVHGDDAFRRLKVASADPLQAEIARQGEQVVIDRSRPYLMRAAVESRQPILFEHLDPDEAARYAQDAVELVRAARPTSAMVVPLVIHDQLLGTLTFVSSNPQRRYNARDLRLAQTVGERAAMAIDNARLYRQALQATRVRDQVLGVVAHDLRNPLTAILMHASTLQRRGSEPDRRNPRPREMILRSARRMNRLIQDLLDVAVVESGNLKLERTSVSPWQLVSETVDAQREIASAAGLELKVEVPDGLPELWGDPHRLQQVLENLIGNAVKFTDFGGRLTIGAARGESGVVFWVADTGHGIKREDLDHIFSRFWHGATRGRGAGLGLTIAHGIVAAHGGRIWVESTPGVGSTFYFMIPVRPELPHPAGEDVRGAG